MYIFSCGLWRLLISSAHVQADPKSPIISWILTRSLSTCLISIHVYPLINPSFSYFANPFFVDFSSFHLLSCVSYFALTILVVSLFSRPIRLTSCLLSQRTLSVFTFLADYLCNTPHPYPTPRRNTRHYLP